MRKAMKIESPSIRVFYRGQVDSVVRTEDGLIIRGTMKPTSERTRIIWTHVPMGYTADELLEASEKMMRLLNNQILTPEEWRKEYETEYKTFWDGNPDNPDTQVPRNPFTDPEIES